MQYQLETNPAGYTDMGEKIYLTVQTFRTATELLRARETVQGESLVVVKKAAR